MYKRSIVDEILPWLKRDEIIIIVWARQVGKTSLMYYVKDNFLKEQNTVFLNLEDLEVLNMLNNSPKNLISLLEEQYGFDWKKQFCVFIDEIQYLSNPTNFLKYIYDEYKTNIKLIVSGSSAFYIDKRFKDSLAWRKKIFQLSILSFVEFLFFSWYENLIRSLKDFGNLTSITKNQILNLFDKYFVYWWYPKVVLENDINIKKQIVWEIVNSYLKKDVLEYNLKYPNKLYKLYKILAFQTWNILNKNELANMLDVSTTMIDNYVYLLQTSFHISLLKPFYKNIRKELTKSQKVYIQDTGIRNYLENNFNSFELRQDKWNLFETIVFNQLKFTYWLDFLYYRRIQDKREVDFIIPNENLAIEVKYKYNWKKIRWFDTLKENYWFNCDIVDVEWFFWIC